MIVGVQDIYYNVQNMQRAVDFYGGILGLKLTSESEHWTAFDVGGIRIGLHWTGGAPVSSSATAKNGVQSGATLTFRVSNIHAAVARLQSAGAKLVGKVREESWGSIVAFEDPDGNILKLMEPKITER